MEKDGMHMTFTNELWWQAYVTCFLVNWEPLPYSKRWENQDTGNLRNLSKITTLELLYSLDSKSGLKI